jgi:hypothetical protein
MEWYKQPLTLLSIRSAAANFCVFALSCSIVFKSQRYEVSSMINHCVNGGNGGP